MDALSASRVQTDDEWRGLAASCTRRTATGDCSPLTPPLICGPAGFRIKVMPTGLMPACGGTGRLSTESRRACDYEVAKPLVSRTRQGGRSPKRCFELMADIGSGLRTDATIQNNASNDCGLARSPDTSLEARFSGSSLTARAAPWGTKAA
jgi:hypothetical protein